MLFMNYGKLKGSGRQVSSLFHAVVFLRNPPWLFVVVFCCLLFSCMWNIRCFGACVLSWCLCVCVCWLMSAGQTLPALRLWPGLILTLLTVSQWIKTDWHSSIFDTVTTGWHIRDTLSLQMSSPLSSWKVVKSECVCVSCNKGFVESI